MTLLRRVLVVLAMLQCVARVAQAELPTKGTSVFSIVDTSNRSVPASGTLTILTTTNCYLEFCVIKTTVSVATTLLNCLEGGTTVDSFAVTNLSGDPLNISASGTASGPVPAVIFISNTAGNVVWGNSYLSAPAFFSNLTVQVVNNDASSAKSVNSSWIRIRR